MMARPRSFTHNFLPTLSLLLLLAPADFAQTTNTTTDPSFSVDLAAGIAPVVQDGMAAANFTANRIDMAAVAPDDSIVFTTTNPVRMWRLKNGVVSLIAGGGDYPLNLGFPAKQVDIGFVLKIVANENSVTFLSSSGSIFSVGAAGILEYQGIGPVLCMAQGTDGTMYAMKLQGGVYRRSAGGDWTQFATTEGLQWCTGMTADAQGNVILAVQPDRWGPGILLKVAPSGEKTAAVGALGAQTYSGDGGPSASAGTLNPQSPIVDASGNLYFADQPHLTNPAAGVIRKVTPDGNINALPGCHNCLPAGVDSNGTLLVTVDEGIGHKAPGNLYRYASDGTMAPVLGPASGNTALTTWLDPHDIAIDAGGNMWVASRNRLVKIDPSGNTTVIPGRAADATDANGEPLPSSDFWALKVAVEPDGKILVAGVLPNGAKYSSEATQAAIWRYSPDQDTFENLIVLSPKPTNVDPGVPMTVPAADHFIVDLAEPSNGSVYFITATQTPDSGDRTVYALRPDGSTEKLNRVANALFVDFGGLLWVGQLQLDANDQVVKDWAVAPTGTGVQFSDEAIFGDQVLLLYGNPETPNLLIPDTVASQSSGSGVDGNCITVVNGVQTSSGPCRGFGDPIPPGIPGKVLAYSGANLLAYNGGFGGAGGPILDAKMGLTAITVAADGTYYLADRPNQVIWKLTSQQQGQALFSQNGIVNAASFRVGALAPDALATVYGLFPNATPDTLTVTVTDANGAVNTATITAANPNQVNFLVPAATAPGEATLSILNRDGGVTWSQKVTIADVAPGLFMLPPPPPTLANNFATGFGIAAGYAIRDLGGGQQDTIPLFKTSGDDQHPGTFVVNTVEFSDQPLYLSVYGTGFANTGGLENVAAEVNGVSIGVSYAGPVQDYDGLEQVNIGPLTAEAILPDAPDFLQIMVKGVASNSVEFDVH